MACLSTSSEEDGEPHCIQGINKGLCEARIRMPFHVVAITTPR
jgi:hypothetical protein